MNTKTLLTFKTDKKTKEAVQKMTKELGFSLGTLVNAYLKQIVRDKAIFFQKNLSHQNILSY